MSKTWHRYAGPLTSPTLNTATAVEPTKDNPKPPPKITAERFSLFPGKVYADLPIEHPYFKTLIKRGLLVAAEEPKEPAADEPAPAAQAAEAPAASAAPAAPPAPPADAGKAKPSPAPVADATPPPATPPAADPPADAGKAKP